MAPGDNPSRNPAKDAAEQQVPGIPSWIWLGGAILVLLAILTGLQTRELQNELSRLSDQLHEQRLRSLALDAERRHHEKVLAILSSPETRVYVLRPVLGQTSKVNIRVFWNDTTGPLLIGELVPAPAAGHTFQVWATSKDGAPVRCGEFRPDADRKVSFLATSKLRQLEVQSLWITEEPEGGSPQPTSPPLWKAAVR